MTEKELTDKMFVGGDTLGVLIAEFSKCATARKEICEGELAAILVNTTQISIPQSLIYMCTAVISCKQSILLDQINEQCWEINSTITKYKEEQEEGIAE